MRIIFFLIGMGLNTLLAAQASGDSLCRCSIEYTIRYPKQAAKDNASGTVIIEFEEDENCMWSNPVVIQNAGHGFDDEALRTMRTTIIKHNSCTNKCKSHLCIKHKLKQSITFAPAEE